VTVSAGPTEGAPYRMRDLVRLTGIPRETIYHYLTRRILPPAIKTGRNTALYTEEHLRKLRRIRELQGRFLPLRAIREVLEEETEPSADFTPEQRAFLKRMRASVSTNGDGDRRVPLAELPSDVTTDEVRELAAAGVVEIRRSGRRESVSAEDAAIIECWGRLKATGIDPEHGLRAEHASTHLEAVDRIVRREMDLFSLFYASAGGDEAIEIAERCLPVLNDLIALLHTKKFRQFVAGASARDETAR
jgi:DNA-binding transcriptional MerR regulator